ncbi:MAG: DUF1189 family protein [Patescibacteria group bacterium]
MMKKTKTFFRTLLKSCTSIEYYNDVVNAPSSFSWKYFLAFSLFSLLLGLIPVLLGLLRFDPAQLADKITNVFPQDLEITVQNGQLNINQPLPYIVNVADEQIVFTDDQDIVGVKDLQKYQSPLVITESTVYYQSESEGLKVYPIPNDPELIVVNPQKINYFKNLVLNHPVVKNRLYLPILGLAILIFAYPFILFDRVFQLLFLSLLLLVLSKIFFTNKKLNFAKLVQINIHAMSPIVLINWILPLVIGAGISGWYRLIICLAWPALIISKLKIKKS